MSEYNQENQELVQKITELFPESEPQLDRSGIPTLTVTQDKYIEVVQRLREEPSLKFSILSHLCGLHWPEREKPFEVVVRLTSFENKAQVAVKVSAEGNPPTVPSLAPVWRAAQWHERETYDMFGIEFKGHPDLRRIFLVEEAEYHPMRKEYPTEGTD